MNKFSESGKGNPVLVQLAFATLLISSFLLGFIYSAFTWIMPVVYLNLVVVLNTSGILSIAGLFLFYLFKMQKPEQVSTSFRNSENHLFLINNILYSYLNQEIINNLTGHSKSEQGGQGDRNLHLLFQLRV